MIISEFILNHINRDYFLPSIQREFVWMNNPASRKVETLFDSIMQGYPIGTLIVWRVTKANVNDKIKCDVYKFADDYNTDEPYNEVGNHNGFMKINLILDGQQRLTALNIGLKGSFKFTYYKKNKVKKLFLNLLYESNDDVNNNGCQYEFKFLDNVPKDSNSLWFEVGKVLDLRDQDAEKFKAAYSTFIQNQTNDEEKIQRANMVLGKLFHVFCEKTDVLVEQEIVTQDDEKVLDIFVRTNDGGTKLEKSDLLLSYLEASKTIFQPDGAKKEITNYVRALNTVTETKPNYEFTKDDILKTCLVLSDLDVQYRLKNFNNSNLETISKKWSEIKKYIGLTRDLISYYGFASKSIISKNSIIPIEYVLMKKQLNNAFVPSTIEKEVEYKNEIIKWWIIAQLTGEFGNSSDTTLRKYRDMINAGETDLLKNQNKIEESDVMDWLENEKYGSKYTHLILMLLNNNKYWGQNHVDHLFPGSMFNRETYDKMKLKDNQIKFYNDNCNSIANLCILNSSVNQSKSDEDLKSWVAKQNDEYKISAMVQGLNLEFESFENFIEERKKRMAEKLKEILVS